ncbi:divergent PAP2 family protein [Teichococcus vastitatis]|uniref:Divergent PAP2 family protein n=1 Tax=Teichococcus vastitatis TaxID=2307076 RepID=A0ABS9W9T8_9PROT|nr:divergent PAP2 family protein [Pseudoroseomonas vastitatis]MCI0756067.1 divergent PAP2 family protein [Pseudoroseomonas vastitatis]
MDLAYPLAPVFGYLAAGSLKFAINTLRVRQAAWRGIGLGGAVSTHTTIVWTTCWLLGFRDGFGQPAFAVALTLAVIVMIDAMDLRQKIGAQALALKAAFPHRADVMALRGRLGHKPQEVLAGIALGAACAALLNLL